MAQTAQYSVRGATRRLRALYFFFYAGMGSLLPYLSPYFSSRGLDPSLIGLLLSIQPMIGVAIPPLWGNLADRTNRTMPWLRIQFVVLPIFVILLFHTHGLPQLFIVLALLSCFLTAVPPLLDHVAMGYVQADNLDYGRIRVFGSLGFSFANLCMGLFLTHYPLHDLFWVYAPALLCALAISAYTRERSTDPAPLDRALERTSIQNTENTENTELTGGASPTTGTLDQPLRSGWRDWNPLLGFFLMLLIFSLTVPSYGSYFPLYIQDTHLPAWLTSLSFTLSSGSEVFTMPFATLLYAKRGPRFMLSLSALAYVIRWAVLGIAHSPVLVVGVQALHGVAFGFFYTSSVMYLRAKVPRDRLATGQTLFAATAALGNVLGNLLGGELFGRVGPHHFFEVESGIALICLLFVWITVRN